MNKNHLKSVVKNTTGIVKEEVGHATQDSAMELSGIKDQIVAIGLKKFGDAKDLIKMKIDTLLRNKN